MRTWRPVATAAVVVAVLAGCSSGRQQSRTGNPSSRRASRVAVPEATGPIRGGARGVPSNPMPEGLADKHGYTEQEFFVSGRATAYEASGPLGADGRWTVAPAGTAPYETRILVRRPRDPAKFSGVVLVEWLNVTAGRDADPDFGFLHTELMAAGDAYVGVSAQQVGVEGGPALLQVPGAPREALLALKQWDPARYAPLHHPGDQYSYDIFSQAGQLVRTPGKVDPLHGERAKYVVAVGESQSAIRLVSYVDAVHPLAKVFDGFLIHSRGSGGTRVGVNDAGPMPGAVAIRTDLREPVLQFETETDLVLLGYLAARQPDTDRIVTWEVAGTAHADQSTLDYGTASGNRWYSGPPVDFTSLCGAVNRGPQAAVLRAAFKALKDWVIDGKRAPTSPRLEMADGDIVRDDDGIARGAIRTPAVDAPVATLTGKGNDASVLCSLFGRTIAFTPRQLAELYPTHDDYVKRVTESADAAVGSRFLLRADRDAVVAEAKAAPVPSG